MAAVRQLVSGFKFQVSGFMLVTHQLWVAFGATGHFGSLNGEPSLLSK